MPISTIAMMSFLIAMFFVVLFTLEGYSENGVEGIKERRISISGMSFVALIGFVIFITTMKF